MALPPSSPPLLPHLDFPDTPPSQWEDTDAELPVRPADAAIEPWVSRKRQLSDYGSLSSDPLFSEDVSDVDVAEEAGERPRRKRVLRGPWYDLRPASARSWRQSFRKREKMSNADSGIWLGSDVSDESTDSVLSSQKRLQQVRLDEKPAVLGVLRAPQQSGPEMIADQKVTQCLEGGKETVDLSDLGLTNLSDATLRPLHQLIKHSHADLTEPPSEDEFTTLTPSVQLFVSGNKLTSLPAELFRLTNITVLSLRNNSLHEIPSAIARLTSLQELNIAQNEIRYLPWSLFELLHGSRSIQVRPNPLIKPLHFEGRSPLPRPNVPPDEHAEHLSRWDETTEAFLSRVKQYYSKEDVPWSMRHELEMRLKLGRARQTDYLQERLGYSIEKVRTMQEEMIFLASSAVRYFDVDGFSMRHPGARKSGTDDGDYAAVFDPHVHLPANATTSNVPSLFEVSLRAAQAHYNLRDLPDDIPTPLRSGLAAAAKGTELGNETCATCGHSYIVARAEWVEFWFNGHASQVDGLTNETVLPVMRKACRWSCAKPTEVGTFRLSKRNIFAFPYE